MKQPAQRRESFPEKVAFFEVEEHFVLATHRNVGIAVWVDEMSVEAVLRAEDMLGELASAWPEGIAFVQVFGEESQRIEAPVRTALSSLLQRSHGIQEAPVVYEGTGFRAAAIRAIVTGLLATRSFGFPHRVYASIEEAALAVGRALDKREPTKFARELCEAMARMRERHESAFPAAPHSFIRYKS